MRLLSAEFLKLRRRWASYLVLGLLIGLMALVSLLVGVTAGADRTGASAIIRFPGAYAFINQFVFGLGSLLAVAYAAAIAGADWNWGVFRVVVARGESRTRYVLIKYLAVAVFIVLGILIAYAAGIALNYMAGAMAGISVGDPLAGDSGEGLGLSLLFGSLVVAERAALGFAVAMLLRSQLAGVVTGIVLFIGEQIVATVVLVTTLSGRGFGEGLRPIGPEWFQFLPFSIGDSVLSRAPTIGGGGPEEFFLAPIPLELAIGVTLLYLAGSILVAAFSAERTQISG
ncbi:MAG: ABC transporter permease [Chloroflexota bacterium]|jgi:ABC-type transport system involved in multi-copper enzyme maturation permease subunit|nr:ABC transporter permease [Chloroflexota bacterium]